MRPTVGSVILKTVFENFDDPLTQSALRLNVQTAIAKGEPRAVVTQITVEQGKDTTAPTIIITVYFVVPALRQQSSTQVTVPKS